MIQLQTDEKILFEGDASLLKSALSIVQGSAVGTNQRFVFHGDKRGTITLSQADISSAREVKHGLGTKWAVQTQTGETYQFLAANAAALRQVMLTLTGQEASAQAAHKEPELSAVRNWTAWLAAFGPTLAGFIAVLLMLIAGGLPTTWSLLGLIKLWVFKLAVIYTFLRIDYLKLQAQGYNLQKIGVPAPTNIFTYLFRRAKAFGHGKAYAVVWCASFAEQVYSLLSVL
ncbi:hypothetical protein P3W85_23590 [Cupriavidus basilensis]|uniref:Uncharacterized protein n=1 Tax=Cupriavidus basilensis TaxID=68895 RepID=A0ABT6ATF4_9BURK|nr:hypothetical protein [Cupriavidus basilensis]MDF3835909.1 hypothetical protein [Cupriavidus basilensis]